MKILKQTFAINLACIDNVYGFDTAHEAHTFNQWSRHTTCAQQIRIFVGMSNMFVRLKGNLWLKIRVHGSKKNTVSERQCLPQTVVSSQPIVFSIHLAVLLKMVCDAYHILHTIGMYIVNGNETKNVNGFPSPRALPIYANIWLLLTKLLYDLSPIYQHKWCTHRAPDTQSQDWERGDDDARPVYGGDVRLGLAIMLTDYRLVFKLIGRFLIDFQVLYTTLLSS